MDSPHVEIRPMHDREAALRLGVEAGLTEAVKELSELKVLRGAYEGSQLIGVVAQRQDGALHLVSWLAVVESHRGRGIGEALLVELETEALEDGVGCLWAIARAPGFFFHHGYEAVDEGPEADVLLAECRACNQYGATCTPIRVVKVLSGVGPVEAL
jgi:N-acetylglutamate synthase-like GNAT family acetyltransferase